MSKNKQKSENKYVSMELILPPQNAVRLDIPDDALFELSESMKELGLIEPIILVPLEDKYEIVAGHRRWLAAKKLGWKEIKAEIRELTPEQVALIRATENLQRQDLSPIEEAAIYADLYDNYQFTPKMIADAMGRGIQYIKTRLNLLQMDTKIQQAIHKGQISLAVADELNKINDKKDLYYYLNIAIESGVTAKVVAQWADDYRKSLRYVHDGEPPPDRLSKPINEQKYYTACQLCEGPMEYKDMRTIKLCVHCYDLILKVVDQGYFNRKES